MKTIKLKIVTPERIVLEGEAQQVTLPTQMGEITILPDHVPLISNIKTGIIEAHQNGDVVPMAVSGGFLEFHGNELTILADTAERAEEINLERAEQARKRAEQLKQEQQKSFGESQYASVISQIEKQLARIKVVKKYAPKTKRGITLGNGEN